MTILNMPTEHSSSSAVLLIEPDPGLAVTFRELIAFAYHSSVTIDVMSTLREGLTYIRTHRVPLILMNLALPDDTERNAVKLVHQSASSSAVIGYHRTTDATILSDAIRAGAHDVLPVVPPSAETLRLSITSALIRATGPQLATEPAPPATTPPTVAIPLAKVVHDLNNCLTSINGYADILLARLSAGDPSQYCAEQIKLACGRAENVIKQLSTTTGPSSAPHHPTPINNAPAA